MYDVNLHRALQRFLLFFIAKSENVTRRCDNSDLRERFVSLSCCRKRNLCCGVIRASSTPLTINWKFLFPISTRWEGYSQSPSSTSSVNTPTFKPFQTDATSHCHRLSIEKPDPNYYFGIVILKPSNHSNHIENILSEDSSSFCSFMPLAIVQTLQPCSNLAPLPWL